MRYVLWESCTTRTEEQDGKKTDPVWEPDASGVIREVPEHLHQKLAHKARGVSTDNLWGGRAKAGDSNRGRRQ